MKIQFYCGYRASAIQYCTLGQLLVTCGGIDDCYDIMACKLQKKLFMTTKCITFLAM